MNELLARAMYGWLLLKRFATRRILCPALGHRLHAFPDSVSYCHRCKQCWFGA